MIRRITELEAWRLMGFSDEDFYKSKDAGVPLHQLDKQAGNSIVVDVLMAIFKQMLDKEQIDGEESKPAKYPKVAGRR